MYQLTLYDAMHTFNVTFYVYELLGFLSLDIVYMCKGTWISALLIHKLCA